MHIACVMGLEPSLFDHFSDRRLATLFFRLVTDCRNTRRCRLDIRQPVVHADAFAEYGDPSGLRSSFGSSSVLVVIMQISGNALWCRLCARFADFLVLRRPSLPGVVDRSLPHPGGFVQACLSKALAPSTVVSAGSSEHERYSAAAHGTPWHSHSGPVADGGYVLVQRWYSSLQARLCILQHPAPHPASGVGTRASPKQPYKTRVLCTSVPPPCTSSPSHRHFSSSSSSYYVSSSASSSLGWYSKHLCSRIGLLQRHRGSESGLQGRDMDLQGSCFSPAKLQKGIVSKTIKVKQDQGMFAAHDSPGHGRAKTERGANGCTVVQ